MIETSAVAISVESEGQKGTHLCDEWGGALRFLEECLAPGKHLSTSGLIAVTPPFSPLLSANALLSLFGTATEEVRPSPDHF